MYLMMMMATRTFQIWILVLFSPYFPNYVTNILSWAWKVSTLETTAIFSLFGSHIHIPQWWGHQQTGGIVLAQSLIKIMCTHFYFLLHFFKRIFCLQNQENCSFGNGIYSRFLLQDAFSEKNFKKGVKLDSSSLPLSFTFKMKWL